MSIWNTLRARSLSPPPPSRSQRTFCQVIQREARYDDRLKVHTVLQALVLPHFSTSTMGEISVTATWPPSPPNAATGDGSMDRWRKPKWATSLFNGPHLQSSSTFSSDCLPPTAVAEWDNDANDAMSVRVRVGWNMCCGPSGTDLGGGRQRETIGEIANPLSL